MSGRPQILLKLKAWLPEEKNNRHRQPIDKINTVNESFVVVLDFNFTNQTLDTKIYEKNRTFHSYLKLPETTI